MLADDLRAPLMVHRGDVVTVHVETAGIHIRTTARSRDDGAQGELVSVESLLNRSTFYARVSNFARSRCMPAPPAWKRPRTTAQTDDETNRNTQYRNTKQIQSTKCKGRKPPGLEFFPFRFRICFGFRYPDFAIPPKGILMTRNIPYRD